MAGTIAAPDGIALPFALQHRFLTSSPAVQQGIGKLKMALELDAVDVVDALCLHLQQLIRNTPMPDEVTRQITQALPDGPDAANRLVVRSSSNAEDLPGLLRRRGLRLGHHRHGPDELLDAVRQVWASLLSPRSVRLRHQAGISLDDTYMGVIIQRYVPADLGGVLVTCNPTKRADFRNVYLNCSPGSPETVVDGTTLPLQYLYNTVEGGGRTVALGSPAEDLPAADPGPTGPAGADRPAAPVPLQRHRRGPSARHRVADDRSGGLPPGPDPPLRAVIRPFSGLRARPRVPGPRRRR